MITSKPTCKLKHTDSIQSILNISAKCHQNRSLQSRAIPFQSWCIFETVYGL